MSGIDRRYKVNTPGHAVVDGKCLHAIWTGLSVLVRPTGRAADGEYSKDSLRDSFHCYSECPGIRAIQGLPE